MNWPRVIAHLDLDAFYCSVEENLDPSLRGKPFAVGGRPSGRGVVASCSYAARQFGVRSAMPMARAVRQCPGLLVVPPKFSEYREASKRVMAILREMTDLVEQLSIDEAFLDLSAIGTSDPAEVGKKLQDQISVAVSLPASLGIATNKLVAKIANDYGKSKAKEAGITGTPKALTVVSPGEEPQFLAPLPVDALWGVGPKTAEKLGQLGVTTIGDLAIWPKPDLEKRFGKMGREMSARAKGLDTRSVVVSREAKSISQEVTFEKDVADIEKLRATIKRQAEQIAKSLQKRELAASTVKIKLRWPDFSTLSRQVTLTEPTDQPEEINAAATRLFENVWSTGKAVRLLGVGVSKFGKRKGQKQLSLF